MPLPPFDAKGDLPEGIHVATLEEVSQRFGKATEQLRCKYLLGAPFYVVRTAGKFPVWMANKAQRRKARNCGDSRMITDDNELKVTLNRIEYFQNLLAQFRITARREEFPLVANGYRAEIEKMQTEVLDYLTRHVSETAQAA